MPGMMMKEKKPMSYKTGGMVKKPMAAKDGGKGAAGKGKKSMPPQVLAMMMKSKK
jgi:hypothetical protein